MTRPGSTTVVLFDLGGVLVELGGVDDFRGLLEAGPEVDLWRLWLESPAVRRFERGSCSPLEFSVEAVAEFGLALSPDAFLERFRAWPRGLLPGGEELVRSLRDEIVSGCLSNTNALHWRHQVDAERLRALFARPFVSHEMGLVKPDPEAFEHVRDALGCPAREILFLDDNAINVEGARRVGFDAHRVSGVEQTRALLHSRDLLRSSGIPSPAREG